MSNPSPPPGKPAIRKTADGSLYIQLSGKVDESWSSEGIPTESEGVILLDLKGIEQFTSGGIRKWVKFIAEIRARYLGIVHARPGTVAQFNSVMRFGGRGELISLYAPYVCTVCSKYDELLIDLRTEYTEIKKLKAPGFTCASCNGEGELDDVPEAFFYYVANANPPMPPPAAVAMLDGPAVGAPSPFRLAKDVQDQFTALWVSGEIRGGTQVKHLAEGLDDEELVVIVEGLIAPTPQVIGRLRPILDKAGGCKLARVPQELALMIQRAEGGYGNAKIYSLLLPGKCSVCKSSTSMECTREAVQSGSFTGKCRRCGSPGAADVHAAVEANLKPLPMTAANEDVAAYLTTHEGPPSDSSLMRKTAFTQITNKYRLENRLGFGGMAEVFLAQQRGLGGFEKQVVIKRILPHLAADQAFIEMFLSEARLAARINHANVVQIFDVDQDQDGYFIAMEFVDGVDLSKLLRAATELGETMPLVTALRITRDVCLGLHAAHTVLGSDGKVTPIVHRDISPHNVLVSTQGLTKVTDFGIAKAQNVNSGTPVYQIKGKLPYLAPEQFTGSEATPQSDIFATGILLYHALTLNHPFKGPNDLATMRNIGLGQFPLVSSKRADVTPAIDAILARAMATSEKARYPTADEMRLALDGVLRTLEGSADEAKLREWTQKVQNRARKHDDPAVTRRNVLPTNESTPTLVRGDGP